MYTYGIQTYININNIYSILNLSLSKVPSILIKGTFIRIDRNCSTVTNFHTALQKKINELKGLKYPNRLLDNITRDFLLQRQKIQKYF